MLEDAVELLTKLKIQEAIKEHENGKKTMIEISKVDLIGICIDLCKVLKQYEVEYEYRNKI